LEAFGNGYTFGEAAWAAQPVLSWQTTVIGDPLYRPFGNLRNGGTLNFRTRTVRSMNGPTCAS
jgi:hypothetical protein